MVWTGSTDEVWPSSNWLTVRGTSSSSIRLLIPTGLSFTTDTARIISVQGRLPSDQRVGHQVLQGVLDIDEQLEHGLHVAQPHLRGSRY